MKDFEFINRMELRQKRDFGEKINATFDFLRSNFTPLYRGVVFILLPIGFLGGVIAGFMKVQMGDLLKVMKGDHSALLESTNNFVEPEVWGIILLGILGTVVSIALVYAYMKLYLDGKEDITVDDLKRLILKTIGPIFFAMLGFMLMYFAFTFVSVFVITLAASIPILMGILFTAVFIVFLYALITMFLVYPIMLIEEIGFLESLPRAFYLISGKWWSTFGLVFVLLVTMYLITLVFMMPLLVAGSFLALNDLDGFMSIERVVYVIGNVISNIGSYLITPIILVGVAFQYFNLVELKESKGLLDKIEGMGRQNTDNSPEETY